jgi:hypothetical protein
MLVLLLRRIDLNHAHVMLRADEDGRVVFFFCLSTRGVIGSLHFFWAPWVQVLAGLDRIKRAKTSIDISFGGLCCIQRAKKPMLIGCSHFSSQCKQSTTPAVCLPSEGHSH